MPPYAPQSPSRPSFQIAFQIQGERQSNSVPISQKEFTQEQMDQYLTALCQDCEAFQGRASYADHILPGYHIRYDDMAKDHLTGILLPADAPHTPGQPDKYMNKVIFMFAVVLKKGEVDDDVRQLMLGFHGQGMNYTPVPRPPYCILMPWQGYPHHTHAMPALYTAMRGYAMAWYLLNNVYN